MRKIFTFLLALVPSLFVFGQTVVVETNPTSPWTVPAGVTSVKVECWGGGGGGGGSNSTAGTRYGGGGGGGGYSVATYTVSAGQTYAITIGSGGTVGSNADGGAGGTTTFTGTAGTLTAGGGGGGLRYSSSPRAGGGAAGDGNTFDGGVGGTGSGNGAGGGGGAGNNGNGNAGANATTGTGGTGNPNSAPYKGGNGGDYRSGNGDGNSGSAPGGGGGGGRSYLGNRPGGAGASGQVVLTYTLPAPPATPGTPTSNSPQCNSVTITRNGTVPTGETWYWQTSASGTAITSSGATYSASSSGTYYIRSKRTSDGVWSSAASVAVVVNSVPAAVTTPSPANGATGVCFSGVGAVSLISWTASATATSYDVYFGTASNPPLVSTSQAGLSYNTGTLASNTIYYCKVIAKNACGSATATSWSFTTSSVPCYCTSTSTSSSSYFNSFSTTGGLTNITNSSSGYSAGGYGNFLNKSVSQNRGSTVNFNTSLTGTTVGVKIWVDWNQDGDFVDSGEEVYWSGSSYVSSASGSFSVPATATPGATVMRIRMDYNLTAPAICGSITRGETEDYTFNVIQPAYAAQYISQSTGSSTWCAGETRTVSVTIKNVGTQSWADGGGEDFNIGVKWNADADPGTWRVDAQNLASGATQTYSLTVTAPAAGADNLTFNVVREGVAWFGGPYASSTITINALPTSVNAGSDATICSGSITPINGSAVGQSGTATATYSSGNANTLYSSSEPATSTVSSCPISLSVAIPAGSVITGVNVSYNMIALDDGWMSEQRSYLQCTSSGGVSESSVYSGVGSSTGTMSYTRNNLTIANAVTGGGTINFQLHAFRTYGGSGCNTTYNYVNNSTFTITVNYIITPTYSWSPSTGLSNANIANPTASPSSTTTYTMTATANGCSASDAVIVNVNSLSTAPTSITGTTTICSGGSTTLTANGGTTGTGANNVWFAGSCASEAYSQQWASPPASVYQTTINPSTSGIINVTSTGGDPMIHMYSLGSWNPLVYKYINVRYRVVSGTAGNCEIFFTNTSYPAPTGIQDYANGVLNNDGSWHVLTIDMPASNAANNGGTNYWNTGGNITGWRFDWATNTGATMEIDYITLTDKPIIGEGNSITVSPSSTTTYYTAKKGECNTTACASTTVTVNSAPTAPTSITGTTTICSGSTTTLSASGGSEGSGCTYQWGTGSSVGSNVIGTATSASYTTSSLSSNTTYWVRRVGNTGCTNTTAGVSQLITVNSAPTAPTSITGTTTICSGSTTTLSASGGSEGSGCTYQWGTGSNVGSNIIGTATSESYTTSSLTANTTYWVRRVGDSECTNTTGGVTQLVTVNTAPTAPTSITGTTTICSGNTTELSATGGSEGSGCTYQWGTGSSVGSNIIGAATSDSYTTSSLSSNTTYWVRRVGNTGCTNTTGGVTQLISINSAPTAPTGISGTTTVPLGQSTTLTATGGSEGSSCSYEWFEGGCGSGLTLGTNSSITVSPIVNTTYYVRRVGENPCSNTTLCANVLVNVTTSSSTWTGALTTDWNTAGNWSPASVPNASNNAIIPNVSRKPIINMAKATPAQCNNLTINAGSSVTINPGKALTVNGNLLINGTITIKSNVTDDGSLIVIGSRSGGGLTKVEKYLSSGKWHLVSSPITSGVSSIFQGLWLRTYDETLNRYGDYISSMGVPLTPGQGFSVWSNSNLTKVFSGTFNHGDIGPIDLKLTGAPSTTTGWNLIGNPYPSAIDWDAPSGWTKNNVANAVYVWNQTQYATYVAGVGQFGGSRNIALGQGFLVQALNSGSEITIKNGAKIHSTSAFLKNNEVANVIRVNVFSPNYSDETVIAIRNDVADDFDVNYDAIKLYGSTLAPQMYTYKENYDAILSINSLNSINKVYGMVINIEYAEWGEHFLVYIHSLDFNNIPILFDHVTQSIVSPNIPYQYMASPNDPKNRFQFIEPMNTSIVNQNASSVMVWENENILHIGNLSLEKLKTVNVYDVQGKMVYFGSETIVDLNHLKPGTYVARVTTDIQTIVKKITIK